jgi:hypothetical protein
MRRPVQTQKLLSRRLASPRQSLGDRALTRLLLVCVREILDAFHLRIPRFECEKAGSKNPVRRPIGNRPQVGNLPHAASH